MKDSQWLQYSWDIAMKRKPETSLQRAIIKDTDSKAFTDLFISIPPFFLFLKILFLSLPALLTTFLLSHPSL